MGLLVFLCVLGLAVIGYAYVINQILFWTLVVSLCVLSLASIGLHFMNEAVDPADFKRGQ
jgi:quinol-cytochrome oxidoreductase complex cytochrome b subunit